MKTSSLLLLDGAINLALGLLLWLVPAFLLSVLGMPRMAPAFFASILGAVLTGIGVSLLVERAGGVAGHHGLGLAGAVAINLTGAIALGGWLLLGRMEMMTRGYVILWILVGILLGISAVELRSIKKE